MKSIEVVHEVAHLLGVNLRQHLAFHIPENHSRVYNVNKSVRVHEKSVPALQERIYLALRLISRETSAVSWCLGYSRATSYTLPVTLSR